MPTAWPLEKLLPGFMSPGCQCCMAQGEGQRCRCFVRKETVQLEKKPAGFGVFLRLAATAVARKLFKMQFPGPRNLHLGARLSTPRSCSRTEPTMPEAQGEEGGCHTQTTASGIPAQ